YGYWQGTSFSSPLVTGVAALMWSVNPNLSAASLVNLLQSNADVLGAAVFAATYGYGRLNAYRAVLAARDSVSSDITAPSVAISYPSAGFVVSGSVQVQGNALDNEAVAKVEFYVDGQLTGTSTLSAFSFGWNTATAANGSHTLQVKAYDAAGNAGSASISVTVDNVVATDTTPPSVAITSPADGTTINGRVAIRVTATDAGGIKLVYFFIDNVQFSSDASAPYSYTYDAKKAARGTHVIKVTAVDAAGNSASASINVIK
ncbi:MAG: Ig-like domain-containing protein, partial [Bryobacteraceae bacterium]